MIWWRWFFNGAKIELLRCTYSMRISLPAEIRLYTATRYDNIHTSYGCAIQTASTYSNSHSDVRPVKFQTSNLTCTELNANMLKQKAILIYIEYSTAWEVPRLNWQLRHGGNRNFSHILYSKTWRATNLLKGLFTRYDFFLQLCCLYAYNSCSWLAGIYWKNVLYTVVSGSITYAKMIIVGRNRNVSDISDL